MHTVGVCGVVTNPADEVLLVRTATAGWELPGGRVEPGEDLFDALRREVREEGGCRLEAIGRLTGVYVGVRSASVLLVFRATVLGNGATSAIQDDEVLEAGWFAPEHALRLVTHVSEHQRLEDALAGQPEAVYRAYRGG